MIDLTKDSLEVRIWIAEKILGWKKETGEFTPHHGAKQEYGTYTEWITPKGKCYESLPDFLHDSAWTGPLEDRLDELMTTWELHSVTFYGCLPTLVRTKKRYYVEGITHSGKRLSEEQVFHLMFDVKNIAIAQAIQEIHHLNTGGEK